MRAVIVTEGLVGVALRASSKARRTGSIWRPWDGPYDRASRFKLAKKLHSIIFLCCGILLCSTFFFALCTVDAPTAEEKPRITSIGEHFEFTIPKRWRLLDTTNIPGVADLKKGDQGAGEAALHGLGVVFKKGTRSMDELIVANFQEHSRLEDFRLFLRTLHRSGATARADLVLLFPWSSIPAAITEVLREEDESFQKLITSKTTSSQSRTSRGTSDLTIDNASISTFNALAFQKATIRNSNRSGSVIWGNATVSGKQEGSLGWGSIVGFEMNELDPDNILSGFLNNPPAQLRRWVCYQLLLGMLKRRFRRVLLAEVGGVVVLGDVFAAVRKKDCLYLTLEDRTWNDLTAECHDQRKGMLKLKEGVESLTDPSGSLGGAIGNSQKDFINIGTMVQLEKDGSHQPRRSSGSKKLGNQNRSLMEVVYGSELWRSLEKAEKERKVVSSGVIMGSLRSVRALANSMVTEVVRVAMQRGSKHPFPDRALVSYLIQKSSVLGRRVTEHLKVVENEESVIHSLDGSKQAEVFVRKDGERYTIVQFHGSDFWKDIDDQALVGDRIMADICSTAGDAAFYDDCRPNKRMQDGKKSVLTSQIEV